MRIAVFSSKPYDRQSLGEANRSHRHELLALAEIAETTLANATAFERGEGEMHLVSFDDVRTS